LCPDQVTSPNHHILIVGWDDDLCGGDGTWIAKNDYGTGWGTDGFFCLQYGSWGIGGFASVITGYKDFDPYEKVYYYDELGFTDEAGYGDGDDCGMVEITPEEDGWLYDINTWAVSGPTTFSVSVWDTGPWGGGWPNLLGESEPDTVANAGFYTIPLLEPVELSSGVPVYILVRYNAYGYPWPIPYDDPGPMANKSYVSDDGGLLWDTFGSGDISIRARTLPWLIVDAPETPVIPTDLKLNQNQPNPFNPTTEITYELPSSSNVKLEIFDVSGRRVATLVDEYQDAGVKTVRWGGRNASGSPLNSGVYFCRLQAGRNVQSKKMILLK
jgi:hypothetical protein